MAYVALTVRSIQLVLGSISEELTEDCRNICPENLKKNEIEQCLDRSLYLPFQGRIFLQKWLTHMTQIVSAKSSWDNNHHYVNFWQKLELSENVLILSLKNYLRERNFVLNEKILKVPKLYKVVIIISAWLSTQNLSQVKPNLSSQLNFCSRLLLK